MGDMYQSAIEPFKLSIPDQALGNLHQRLLLTTLPDELEVESNDQNAQWAYGVPLKEMQRLVAYWKDGFDWRQVETKINGELDMFKTKVPVEGFEELDIHFVHRKSVSNPSNAIPLLFIHGCTFST